jgi:hypothetical protein
VFGNFETTHMMLQVLVSKSKSILPRAIVSIILTALFKTVFAYPISPRPLRKLVMESEYIVYADVIAIKKNKNDDHWNDHTAVLEIREVLQGNIFKEQVKVQFTPYMICPAPARYTENTTVLAFLDKHKRNYTTHALSYGSKLVDSISYFSYKQRIKEMQEIITISNKKARQVKTVEWLIKCAVDSTTRWEGTYELSPKSDFMSNYDRGTFISKDIELTRAQLDLLRQSLLQTKQLSYNDFGLIDLVEQENDKELLEFLVLQLKSTKIESIWFRKMLMERIANQTEKQELKCIVSELEDISYADDKKEEKEAKLCEEFMRHL